MSFNINGRLNNLQTTTNAILADVNDLQNVLNSFLRTNDATTLYQLLSDIQHIYIVNPAYTLYYNAAYINNIINNLSNNLLNNYLSITQSDSKYQILTNLATLYDDSNSAQSRYYNAAYINNLISNYYTITQSNNRYQLISNLSAIYVDNPLNNIYYNASYINSLINS